MFDPITNMAPGILTRKDRITGGITQSRYFWTMPVPCLNYFHDLFYVNKIKIRQKNIGELLTPRGLAFMVMGDGFLIKGGGVMLCTDSFTKEQVRLLVDALALRFGLSCTLCQHRANVYRLYIHKSSLSKLRAIVIPFLCRVCFVNLVCKFTSLVLVGLIRFNLSYIYCGLQKAFPVGVSSYGVAFSLRLVQENASSSFPSGETKFLGGKAPLYPPPVG